MTQRRNLVKLRAEVNPSPVGPAIVNVVAIVIFSKGYPITKEKLNEQICLMREKRSKAGISE